MEENTQSSGTLFEWRTMFKERRFMLGIVVTVGALLLLWVVTTLLQSTMGIGSGVSYTNMGGEYAMMDSSDSYAAPTAVSGRMMNKVSSEVYYPPTPYPGSGGTGGYEESQYETRSYSAQIKTANYKEACDTVESWKPLEHIVFEQANRGDTYCTYRFKVERDAVPSVLTALQKLAPRDLNEQTDVVKRQLLEYTSELDILQKREALLTKTLDDVSAAYDELVTLSKDARDVETLAKVIDGKLNYIERLSQQRIQVASEIDAIARAKADIADRIDFVYFDVSVQKIEFVDGKQLKDSWTNAVRMFVTNTNATLQGITFGVLGLILWLVQSILQLVILFVVVIVIAKYGWRTTKRFWQS